MSKYHAVFVFNPFCKVDAMPMAPALLKGICDSHGLKATTLDLNIETQIAYRDNPYKTEIEKYLMFFTDMPEEAYDWYQEYIELTAKRLIEIDANWIGFSLLSYQSLCFTHDICFAVKKIRPNQKIMIGGPGISKDDNIGRQYKDKKLMSDVMLETGLCDTVVINEAENVLVDILVKDTKGKINTGRQLNRDELNLLPTPSYIDYKTDLYTENSKIFHLSKQATAATITGSKGCVRKCTFCDVASFEPKFVFKDGDKIADEMIEIYETQGITNFFMSDSLINGSMKAFRQMNEALVRRLPPKTLSYYGEYIARPKGQTTKDDYKLMSEAGCKHVIVGVESGSESVRNHMGKKFNNEDLSLMIESLYNVGISQEWNLMVGYLTETRKDFQETLALVKKYEYMKWPDLIINPVGILHVLPGTPLVDTHARSLEIEWEDVAEGVGMAYDFWYSKNNPDNTFENRIQWWEELLELCNEIGQMHEYRYKSKKALANNFKMHWRKHRRKK